MVASLELKHKGKQTMTRQFDDPYRDLGEVEALYNQAGSMAEMFEGSLLASICQNFMLEIDELESIRQENQDCGNDEMSMRWEESVDNMKEFCEDFRYLVSHLKISKELRQKFRLMILLV